MSLAKLKRLKLVPPGPIALNMMLMYPKHRRLNLSWLNPINDYCKWCELNKLPTKRHHYCSKWCSDSAFIYFNPQDVTSKAWHLIERQQCSCRGCGEDYSDKVDYAALKTIEGRMSSFKSCKDQGYNCGYTEEESKRPTYYGIGYRISRYFDLDHIKPIFKGGQGTGIDNMQMLCRSCHKTKTANERKR